MNAKQGTATATKARPVLIGLYSSSPGQGKTTTAFKLVEAIKGNVAIVPFAGPLKMAACAYLEALGLTDTQATRAIYDRKDTDVPGYSFNGRQLLVWLGTKVGRDCIHKDLWVQRGSARINEKMREGFSVVVDDVRMENEADAITKLGGHLVRVTNVEALAYGTGTTTVTEGRLEHYPFVGTIRNTGTLQDLDREVKALIRSIK